MIEIILIMMIEMIVMGDNAEIDDEYRDIYDVDGNKDDGSDDDRDDIDRDNGDRDDFVRNNDYSACH